VLAAGALWGCISLFVRHLTAAGLSAMDISCVRMIVGALGMFIVVLVTDRSLLRIRLRDIWLFVGTGIISVTLFNICYFICMNLSEASIAVVLLYTSPVFVMLMSALFFKEKITGRKVAALVLTFAGCVLVAGLLGGSVHLTPLALGVGIASGFFYATYSIFGRVALKRYDTLTITFYTFVAGTVACSIIGDVPGIVARTVAEPSLLIWEVGLGMMCTIFPYLLYTYGLSSLDPSKAAILATIEPLVGSLLGILAYGESTSPQKLAGMALILLAIVLANSTDRASKQRV
jgi:drug/metabolite transporter (DMT)-like permease